MMEEQSKTLKVKIEKLKLEIQQLKGSLRNKQADY
jgi:hypothetical protein